MTTTIHTAANTNVRPATYRRNPALRNGNNVPFLHFNLRGLTGTDGTANPAVHSFSITADQIVRIIADDIIGRCPPSEYWIGNVKLLRDLIDHRITSTGGWSSPYLVLSYPALGADAVARATAILTALVPALVAGTVPSAPETVLTDDIETGELIDDIASDAPDTATPTARTKQQLADALRTVDGRDDLPELSERALKRANLVQLAALAELFGV